MIVYKSNKGFEQRSDMPNNNWTTKNCYIVEDGTDLANKIMKAYPYYNFIEDEYGNLIDIEILENPSTEEPPKALTETEQRLADLEIAMAAMMGG